MKALLLTLLSFTALAQSPVRAPGEPYEFYMEDEEKVFGRTAMSAAQKYTEAQLPRATVWSEAQLAEGFKLIRDERFLRWSKRADFPRRAPWLFPVDGCYMRALLVNNLLNAKGYPAAKKIFAYGDLSVTTPFADGGKAFWWYHVALVVEVNGAKFVLDPSVEPSRALELDAWLKRMGDTKKMKVAICGAGAYLPKSKCNNEKLSGLSDELQTKALDQEWDNLAGLKLDPEVLLGITPPWAISSDASAK
jgi:hypothetical protein